MEFKVRRLHLLQTLKINNTEKRGETAEMEQSSNHIDASTQTENSTGFRKIKNFTVNFVISPLYLILLHCRIDVFRRHILRATMMRQRR